MTARRHESANPALYRGLLGTTLTAGCQDDIGYLLLDEDDFQATAAPTGVNEDTLGSLEYERVATEKYRIEEELDIAGESRTIEAGNWVASYVPEGAKAAPETGQVPTELKEVVGAFGILTTSDFTIAGRTQGRYGGSRRNPH